MTDDPIFEIGLVMAGAVSAGAYSAGVMDFLGNSRDLRSGIFPMRAIFGWNPPPA
jgi:hypothetical protein